MAARTWYGPGRCRASARVTQVDALLDGGPVPAGAVLLVEGDQLAVRSAACLAAGVGEQHQREEPGDLAVLGKQAVHRPDQPATRIVRHPGPRPLPGRREQRLLYGVLGRVETAVPPHQRAQDLRRVPAQQVLGVGGGVHGVP
jgi:hypothetical protein